MDWIIFTVTLVLLLAYIFLRRKGQITADAAVACLKQGAVLIDVRTPVEFERGHPRNAINIPVEEIEQRIAQRVEDKHRAILLYCQSGTRSSVAKNRLNALGYTQVHNLGSYDRAMHIVERV
jgi:phage shock protein E